MNIFISCRQPRYDPESENLSNRIAHVLKQAGHITFIAYQEIAHRKLTPQQFMPFVRQQISTSDLVIVIYSAELRGGLIELGIAYALGIPIWLVVQPGRHISSSASACAQQVIEYTSTQDLEMKLYQLISGE